MDAHKTLQIRMKKISTPAVYLDTCILLELAKIENGKCKSEHRKELEKLYLLLKQKMQQGRILCPMGNQLVEMGSTKCRKVARDFLYSFANTILFEPSSIKNRQMNLGYDAFLKGDDIIYINGELFVEEDCIFDERFMIRIPYIVSDKKKIDEARDTKNRIADTLNKMKKTGEFSKDFNTQLIRELDEDANLFLNTLKNCKRSEEDFLRYIEIMVEIQERTGILGLSASREKSFVANQYYWFLKGEYHHILPYNWITSVLWARRICGDKKICVGDNLDTVWAAAYLPFVGYAITDNSFCELLNCSGLAGMYNTKVYCMKTLGEFIDEIKDL